MKYIINILALAMVLSCNPSTSPPNSTTNEPKSLAELEGTWKPVRFDFMQKNQNMVDSEFYPQDNYAFYSFLNDSLFYIELRHDSLCYNRTGGKTGLENNCINFGGIYCPVSYKAETLLIKWTTDSIFDVLSYNIRYTSQLPKPICVYDTTNPILPIDSLPSHN
jgi:hypothetical protein